MGPNPPLSTVLPPLIMGTGTFNHQYVEDPFNMPSVQIVRRCLDQGVTAFDTSPYYGPSEQILGDALQTLSQSSNPPRREDYMLITKCGRIAGDSFDYTPAWIRYSIFRSLERLHTSYLDLVYTHDVEFVSATEAMAAVAELRRLRDEGYIRYVGISGYPLDVLCDLAAQIRDESGEPLDAVLSYGQFTMQNTTLYSQALPRLRKAGVEVVLTASMLGLGLLTTRGIDAGIMRNWHPAPAELKAAMRRVVAALAVESDAEFTRIEPVALAYAQGMWGRLGAEAGTLLGRVDGSKQGVCVMGVATIAELDETLAWWRETANPSSEQLERVRKLVEEKLWPIMGEWKDRGWESPGPGFVNTRKSEEMGKVPDDGIMEKYTKK